MKNGTIALYMCLGISIGMGIAKKAVSLEKDLLLSLQCPLGLPVISPLAKRSNERAGNPIPFALCAEKSEWGQSAAVLEQVSTTVPNRFTALNEPLISHVLPHNPVCQVMRTCSSCSFLHPAG